MARLKYAPGEVPLVNEHLGNTFQPNHYGQSMFPASKSARTRRPSQNEQQQNLMKAVRFWRNMSVETKANWNTFATTYPQASRRNPAVFLSGYQLFLKRSHYCFLNHGLTSDFMEEPELEELPDPEITISVESSNNVIDCTENYIKYFGRLPSVGDFVLCRVYPFSEYSGQFFAPIEITLPVLEVFIDGLFVSLTFPAPTPRVTYSVYLSKVVYQSVNYIGTKIRYMGCFTPKEFLELTDTPNSYVDQAGKTVIVNETEDGLTFGEGGGGGLTCEDLPECPTIISINEIIASIGSIVSENFDTSIPPIKLGLLYNGYVLYNSANIGNSGFIPCSHADVLSLIAYLGNIDTAGGMLKETGFQYFNSPNTGASNSTAFNGRGAGIREFDGQFSSLAIREYFWSKTQYHSYDQYHWYLGYNTARLNWYALGNRHEGKSIRLVNHTTSLSNGEKGTYIGNDGKIYRTICLDNKEWLADNLAETLYSDGSQIPEINENAAWASDTNGAFCAYNNDWSNVLL